MWLLRKLANAEQYSNTQLKRSIAQLISYANHGQKPQKNELLLWNIEIAEIREHRSLLSREVSAFIGFSMHFSSAAASLSSVLFLKKETLE